MYNNVQADQYNNSTSTIIPPPSSSFSFSSHPNRTATGLPAHITTSASSSSSSPSVHKGNVVVVGVSGASDSDISLPISYQPATDAMLSTPSSSTKLKSDVDQLDNLVKDLLIEVNRPIDHSNEHRKTSTSSYSYRHANPEPSYSKSSTISSTFSPTKATEIGTSLETPSNGSQRTKTVREERIRIKRGPNAEIPVSSTTKASGKPAVSSSIDEQLIDSLLESVQNTLRKRAEQNQSTWTSSMSAPAGPSNRRTYSSSAAYTDSVHRVSASVHHYLSRSQCQQDSVAHCTASERERENTILCNPSHRVTPLQSSRTLYADR